MKKPLTTRRRKALRWCSAAAALLAAVWVLLPRNLTLEMVHERAMEDLLAAPTETLRQTQALLERNYEEWLVLAQSRDAVCLGVYQKAGWLNWRCKCVLAVDREEGRPFAAGHYEESTYVPSFREDDELGSGYDYVYGCVWDPEVVTLEICLRHVDGQDQWHEQTVHLDVADLETDSRGERWFFVPQGQVLPKNYGTYCSVTAYDSQGNILAKRLAAVDRWEEP